MSRRRSHSFFLRLTGFDLMDALSIVNTGNFDGLSMDPGIGKRANGVVRNSIFRALDHNRFRVV
jgi:hypothetical protein